MSAQIKRQAVLLPRRQLLRYALAGAGACLLPACGGGNPGGDTATPSVPVGLAASAISTTQINLTWAASTDDTAVTGYRVYRNGTQVGTSVATNYIDATVYASGTYNYTVAAYDAAGNISAQSSAASVSVTVTARVYWVDQNHAQADDTGPGTEAQPWKTLQKALAIVGPGDTVNVKAGTYVDETANWETAFRPANSGTAEAPIMFHGVPARAPIIRAHDDGSDGDPAWCIRSRSHIIIDGFTILNGQLKACYSQFIEFRNNEVIGSAQQGSDNSLNWGIAMQATSDCVIRNNYIHDMRNSGNTAHNTACVMLLSVLNTLVENNTADAGGETVYSAFGQKGGDVNDCIWRNNVAKNAYTAFLGMGNTNGTVASERCTFHNNISINCRFFLLLDHWSWDFKIYNNAAYNGEAFVYGGYVAGVENNKNIEAWNNVFYQMPALFRQGGSQGNQWTPLIQYSDYNAVTQYAGLWNETRSWLTLPNWQATTSFDLHSLNITSDPFMDSATGDFHLKANSPLGRAGIDRQDYNSNGDTTERIPLGAYITGSEQIGHAWTAA